MPPRVHLAALLLRVGLGALLLTFGLDKFNQPAQVQQQVASSRLLPEAVAPLFASAIGFWEVGLAALLLLGLLTRPAAIAAAAAIASYTVYNGVVAGYPAFGLTTSGVLDRNVALIFMAFAQAALGGGAFSLDGLLRRRPVRTRLGGLPDELAGAL